MNHEHDGDSAIPMKYRRVQEFISQLVARNGQAAIVGWINSALDATKYKREARLFPAHVNQRRYDSVGPVDPSAVIKGFDLSSARPRHSVKHEHRGGAARVDEVNKMEPRSTLR